MKLAANEIHFVIACLFQKGGGALTIFMHYRMNSGNIHVLLIRIHALLEL